MQCQSGQQGGSVSRSGIEHWATLDGRTQVDKEERETQVEGSAAHTGHHWLSGHRFAGMPPTPPHPILQSRYRLSPASEGLETLFTLVPE